MIEKIKLIKPEPDNSRKVKNFLELEELCGEGIVFVKCRKTNSIGFLRPHYHGDQGVIAFDILNEEHVIRYSDVYYDDILNGYDLIHIPYEIIEESF